MVIQIEGKKKHRDGNQFGVEGPCCIWLNHQILITMVDSEDKKCNFDTNILPQIGQGRIAVLASEILKALQMRK